MTTEPDRYQQLALATWAATNDPAADLRHALMGLAGECGEVINLRKKEQFKPQYTYISEMEFSELGDCWY